MLHHHQSLAESPLFPQKESKRFPGVSPYARYNLRRNPFGELTREERAELAVVDFDRLKFELTSPRQALQFIGECGEGKTTHLLALWQQYPQAPYVYLPEDGPVPEIPVIRPLFLDEAQRLSRRQRRRIFSPDGSLAIGTHEDLAAELIDFGFQVQTIHVGADKSPERLASILNARIMASRSLADRPVPSISLEHAQRLQQTVGFNFRRVEQFLYDQFQDAALKGSLWPTVQ